MGRVSRSDSQPPSGTLLLLLLLNKTVFSVHGKIYTVKIVVTMNVFVTKLIASFLHSALGECMQPNLERSMLPNGDIFASDPSCTFRFAFILYAFR